MRPSTEKDRVRSSYHVECHAVNLMLVFGLVVTKRAVTIHRHQQNINPH